MNENSLVARVVTDEADQAPARHCRRTKYRDVQLLRTQFDGALPITLKAARQVGDILKYVPDGTTPDPRYRFYM